ncbi:MAG: hypothetical protein RQ736_10105 [Thiogranum sp.]|nr:hypothetical protein [Thiogranum sp.]
MPYDRIDNDKYGRQNEKNRSSGLNASLRGSAFAVHGSVSTGEDNVYDIDSLPTTEILSSTVNLSYTPMPCWTRSRSRSRAVARSPPVLPVLISPKRCVSLAMCSTGLIDRTSTRFFTGSLTTTFGISSYELRFSDGGLSAVIPRGQSLAAEVHLNATGTGTLKGIWEVATPGSVAGVPFFKPLHLLTRQVSSGQTARLISPNLPSHQTGNYLVRFRLIEPALNEEPPVLQYVVTQPAELSLPSFELTAPADNARIDSDTQFEWQPVSRAHGYRLELTDRQPIDGDWRMPAVTGVLVKADTHRTRLNNSLLGNLQSGENYWWHVLAIDSAGEIIAASEWKAARAPAGNGRRNTRCPAGSEWRDHQRTGCCRHLQNSPRRE